MDSATLQQLKDRFHKLQLLDNELNRSTNQKDRRKLIDKIDDLKYQMIEEFDLMQYDKHIKNSTLDNHWFRVDISDIIDRIESEPQLES